MTEAPAYYADPQNYPPHTMSDDERAATAGRLSDVDSDYAPEDSAIESHGRPDVDNPEATVAPVPDPTDDPESSEEKVEELEEAEVEEAEVDAEVEELESVESMTVSELKAELDDRGVEYDPRALKAELQDLVTEARANA